MNMVSAKMDPQMLSSEQTELRKEICSNLSQRTQNEPNLFQLGNYLWCEFDIYVWHGNKIAITSLDVTKNIKCKKRSLKCRSKFKAMLFVFFDIQDVVMAERVPSGQTINHHYYIEILTKFAWKIEKETARIVGKRVDFSSGKGAIPYHFVCTAVFSQ